MIEHKEDIIRTEQKEILAEMKERIISLKEAVNYQRTRGHNSYIQLKLERQIEGLEMAYEIVLWRT